MRTTHAGGSGSLFAFFRRKRTTTRSWDDATPVDAHADLPEKELL